MKDQDPLLEFGGFVLDRSNRLLSYRTELIPLKEKTFDVLAVLASSAGKVVDRDQLLTAVWGDTFVEDDNISTNYYCFEHEFLHQQRQCSCGVLSSGSIELACGENIRVFSASHARILYSCKLQWLVECVQCDMHACALHRRLPRFNYLLPLPWRRVQSKQWKCHARPTSTLTPKVQCSDSERQCIRQ